MGSVLSRIMPAREEKPVKVIADLDALVSQRIGFRYLGKDFVIEPVSTERFMEIAGALGAVNDVVARRGKGEDVTEDQVYAAYFDLIKGICPKISMQTLRTMAIPQLHALMNLVVRHVTGQTDDDMVGRPSEEDGKKKTLRT